MVEALMPLARASPANSCFQAGKPAAELPHCAASACGIEHASMAKAAKASFLFWVIKEVPVSRRRQAVCDGGAKGDRGDPPARCLRRNVLGKRAFRFDLPA